MVCCVYELKNETFVAEGRQVGVKEGEGYKGEDHLMPRTQVLPLYTMDEFNRKVRIARIPAICTSYIRMCMSVKHFLDIREASGGAIYLRITSVELLAVPPWPV